MRVDRVMERAGSVLLSGFSWLVVLFLALPLTIIVSTSFTTTAYLQFRRPGLRCSGTPSSWATAPMWSPCG